MVGPEIRNTILLSSLPFLLATVGRRSGRTPQRLLLVLAVVMGASAVSGCRFYQDDQSRREAAPVGPGVERATPSWVVGTEIPHLFRSHHRGMHGGMGDWMPDYRQITSVEVLRTGRWSDLLAGFALLPGDVVHVPEGIEVIYDIEADAPFKALVIDGTLRFDSDLSTRLQVGTIEIGTAGALIIRPRDAQIRAEVIFAGELSIVEDPEEFSVGLFTFGGRVDVAGSAVATPFTRVVRAEAGSSMLEVESTDGWRVGDTLLLADSQPGIDVGHWSLTKGRTLLAQQFERHRIAAISFQQVELEQVLDFDHTSWLAHETRNVVFRSDLESSDTRAHLLFAGATEVSVRNAVILDMGRTRAEILNSTHRDAAGRILPDVILDKDQATVLNVPRNQQARYPLHTHHLQHPFLFEGNVVTGTLLHDQQVFDTRGRPRLRDVLNGAEKWGIVNHQSFGAIRDNVVIGAQGAGIVAEDGQETGVVEDNLVIGTGGGPFVATLHHKDSYLAIDGGEPTRMADFGRFGFGYWFRGPHLLVRGNVAAGYFQKAGFEFWYKSERHMIPHIPRLDASGSPFFGIPDDGLSGSEQSNRVSIHFEDNEVHAITRSALSLAYTGSDLVRGFRANRGIQLGWTGDTRLEDVRLLGEGRGTGVGANAEAGTFDLIDGHIEGFPEPFDSDHAGLVENTTVIPAP